MPTSGTSATTTPTLTISTPVDWAHALLAAVGAPDTAANVGVIVAWEASEGGHWLNSARYNPLNTTQSADGATSINSVGVKAYTSWQQGLNATAQTLNNGNYAGILSALQLGNAPVKVSQAIVASPWGTKSVITPSAAQSYGKRTTTDSGTVQPVLWGIPGTGGIPNPSLPSLPSLPSIPGVDGIASALSSIVEPFQLLGKGLGEVVNVGFWKRAGLLWVGVILIMWGMVAFLFDKAEPIVKDVAAVASVVPK